MAVNHIEFDGRHLVTIGPDKDGGYTHIERYPSVNHPGKSSVVIYRDSKGEAMERFAIILQDSLEEALEILKDKPLSELADG